MFACSRGSADCEKGMVHSMEKIVFADPVTEEETEFFVVEETQLGGIRYLLVTEEEEADCEAYILKEVGEADGEVVFEMLEEETELASVGKVFAELVEDADVEY